MLTPDVARQLQVKRDGVVVYALTPDGPAAQAGLRPGDVLSSVGGEKVATVEQLFGVLRGYEPGQSVKISYVRGGEERTAQVRISDRPS